MRTLVIMTIFQHLPHGFISLGPCLRSETPNVAGMNVEQFQLKCGNMNLFIITAFLEA